MWKSKCPPLEDHESKSSEYKDSRSVLQSPNAHSPCKSSEMGASKEQKGVARFLIAERVNETNIYRIMSQV